MTTTEYILPAYWASYLINGDASGLKDGELEEIEAFLANEELGAALTCSDDSWFAWGNEANGVGGDVMRFTFKAGV